MVHGDLVPDCIFTKTPPKKEKILDEQQTGRRPRTYLSESELHLNAPRRRVTVKPDTSLDWNTTLDKNRGKNKVQTGRKILLLSLRQHLTSLDQGC